MTVISVSDLSFSIGVTPILSKVSFALEENDKLGIIGVNGCGKSTLFRLITGEVTPTEGAVHISKDTTVGILRQDDAFDAEAADMTVLERMYHAFPTLLNMEKMLAELEEMLSSGDSAVIARYTALHEEYIAKGGLEFRARCASILQKLGFDGKAMEGRVSTLSGGQRTRLALAIELSCEPDILMLDEPTNHLDIATLSWLEGFLASYRGCVMVISHDRYFLDRVTSKTLAIEHHKAKLYGGNYTKSMAQRETDREIAMRHWKNQQKEIARQEAYIAQQRAWNRERNIIAAESRQKLLDKMEKFERPEDDPRGIQMKFKMALVSGNDVLNVRGLSMAFGARTLFQNISFLVRRAERVLLIGPNGCGKSTLIKLILGKMPPVSGVIEAGYNVKVGYYDQENQNLTPENTVLEELWSAYPHLTQTEVRNTLGLFRFVGEDVFKTVSVLSGGERARLTLAKLMLSEINVLLLDEPTNHLDITSREVLEEALSAFEGTIIAVSHDRYLIEKLATRILELHPGAPFSGDLLDHTVSHVGKGYSELQAYKEARISEQAPSGAATQTNAPSMGSGKEQYLKGKQAAAEERRRKNRLEKLQKESADLEALIEKIDAELYGSAATDYLRAAELQQQKETAEERLLEIYEELE